MLLKGEIAFSGRARLLDRTSQVTLTAAVLCRCSEVFHASNITSSGKSRLASSMTEMPRWYRTTAFSPPATAHTARQSTTSSKEDDGSWRCLWPRDLGPSSQTLTTHLLLEPVGNTTNFLPTDLEQHRLFLERMERFRHDPCRTIPVYTDARGACIADAGRTVSGCYRMLAFHLLHFRLALPCHCVSSSHAGSTFVCSFVSRCRVLLLCLRRTT